MKELGVVAAIARLEDAEILDPVVDKVRAVVDGSLRSADLRDVMHGVPIGHPVHPFAVQVPLGAWMSAGILDAMPMPGTSRVARLLVGLGVVSALPAAAAGFTDWSKLHEQQARVGLVHSAANLVAVGLYGASYLQRRRGRQVSGRVLGYLGLAVVSGAGFLGGHLSYRQAAGANHAEDVPHRFPQGWQHLAMMDELPDGQLVHREVAGLPVVVFRRGMSVDVLSDVCSHLSGPLSEGEVVGGGTNDPCVVCPWHNSTFSLKTGEVVHGPATAPQPRFDTNVSDGVVEIMLVGAG